MTIDDKTKDEKLQYNIHREEAEISALSSGKIDKYFSVFITQSCFAVPKGIRLNSTHYLVMKIPSKREVQRIEFNHSSDIDF